jgi:hypothetical protein
VTRNTLFLSLLLVAQSASAAVWDRHAFLICRSRQAVVCSVSNAACSRRDTSAVWRVDFGQNRVTYLGGRFTETILAKHVTTFQGQALSESIFLDSGRVMRFHEPREDPAIGLLIPATLTGPELADGVEASTWECSPNL